MLGSLLRFTVVVRELVSLGQSESFPLKLSESINREWHPARHDTVTDRRLFLSTGLNVSAAVETIRCLVQAQKIVDLKHDNEFGLLFSVLLTGVSITSSSLSHQ